MPPRRALVLGATGLVGSRLVDHLLAEHRYARVTCLVRRRTERPASERLEERIVDFGDLEPTSVDGDDLYCAIGSTMRKAGSKEAFRAIDLELPLRVAEIAARAGMTRLALVSSVGADPRASSFYLRTKGELEDALARLPFRALHLFRPSFLSGDRSEARPGEKIGIAVARATQGLLLGGLRKYRPIEGDIVARAMVAAMVGADPSPPRQVHEHDAIVRLGDP